MTLANEIQRANDFGARLQALLNDREHRIKTDRDEMCLLYWSLITDHHGGILLLLRHENHAPAFALVRPMIEAFLRLWTTIHGTDRQFTTLVDDSYRTEFGVIGKQIDEAYGIEPLFGPWLEESKDGLHGFTHGGLKQLVRHKTKTEIAPNFPEAEVRQVLTLTSLIAFLTTAEMLDFLGCLAEHEQALRIYHAYRHPEQ